MKTSRTWLLTCMSVIFIILPSPGTGAEHGIVNNGDTGQPIAGAVVLEIRLGKHAQQDRTECISLRLAATDKRGIYHFASMIKTPDAGDYAESYTNLLAYKPGYINAGMHSSPLMDGAVEIHLVNTTLSDEMRMNYLASLLSSSECSLEKERRKILLPYFRAIYHEAGSISSGKELTQALRGIQRRIAAAWGTNNRNPVVLDKMFTEVVEQKLH